VRNRLLSDIKVIPVDVLSFSVTAVYDILVRRSRIDPVLEGPFKEAEDLVKCRLEEHGNTIGMRELAVIKHYVEECHADARSKTRGNFTSLPIERRQDTLRRLSERFTVATFLKRLAAQQVALKDDSKPPIRKITQFSKNELSRIMASYLYFFDYKSEGKHTRSPWDMAFARLCSIKANDNGEGRMIQNAFYEKMTVRGLAGALLNNLANNKTDSSCLSSNNLRANYENNTIDIVTQKMIVQKLSPALA
jgi:hypothetical protein